MPAKTTVETGTGLGLLRVVCSFRGNGASAISSPVIRDGKGSIVSTVARQGAGHYRITFAENLGQIVGGFPSLMLAGGTDDKYLAGFNYVEASKYVDIFIYDASGAAATDPAAGTRICFLGFFSPRSDLKDPA